MSNNRISMDSVMQASLGEVSNKVTVTFKKTVLIRDYETEVIEATSSVDFQEKMTGIERMFASAIIETQMEYTAYVNLMSKGLITKTEFEQRKSNLEEALYNIKFKAEAMLGKGALDKYLNDISTEGATNV